MVWRGRLISRGSETKGGRGAEGGASSALLWPPEAPSDRREVRQGPVRSLGSQRKGEVGGRIGVSPGPAPTALLVTSPPTALERQRRYTPEKGKKGLGMLPREPEQLPSPCGSYMPLKAGI